MGKWIIGKFGKTSPGLRRRVAVALTLLVMAASFLTLPAPRRAEAAGCGGTDGSLCYVKYDCLRILIWRRCSKTYAYFPEYL